MMWMLRRNLDGGEEVLVQCGASRHGIAGIDGKGGTLESAIYGI
jgi:hypothetical protein